MHTPLQIYLVRPVFFFFLFTILVSDSMEISEEKAADKPNQACVKNSHSEDNLDARQKSMEHSEKALDAGQCPLKPRMLKFKKVKDGKLSFIGRNNYTKLHKKESKCVHVSPLKIVGNDPESESQTLRGYLDEECDSEIVKAEDEQKDDCSAKVVCSSKNSRHKDRGFLVSLQEADIECVAVVCKKTSSISQNRCKISGEDAGEVMEQEFSNAFYDGQQDERQDSEEETASNDIQADMSDTPGKPSDNVNPTVLANSSCEQESEQKRTSHDKTYSGPSQCLESCSQMETDSVSELGTFRQACYREEKPLSVKGFTESDILNKGDIASKNYGVPGPVVTLNNITAQCISRVDVKQNTNESDEVQKAKDVGNGNEENCNMQLLEESVACSGADTSLNLGNILLQNDTGKGSTPTKIALKTDSACLGDDSSDVFQVTSIRNTQIASPVCTTMEEGTRNSSVDNSSNTTTLGLLQNNAHERRAPNNTSAEVASVCLDDDSSDEFQVSSIRNSQMTPPVCNAQNTSKAKKRKQKATKKSKTKTVNQQVKNRNNGRKAPVEWSCNACTFINDGQLLECSVCLTPRVSSDDSLCTTNKKDLGGENGDGVEITEISGVLEVTVEAENINSSSENLSQNCEKARQDMLLEGINGSGQLESSNTRQNINLSQGTAAHQVLVDSKAASTYRSPATENSAVLKKKPCEVDFDNSLVVEPGLPPWSCSACTFLNMSQMIECSICFTPRRRSQRLSVSKNALTVERQEEDCVNRNNSSKRRRCKGVRAKREETSPGMEVDVVNSSVTCLGSSSVNNLTDFDNDTLTADGEGLTPEQEVSHDVDGRQEQGGLDVDSSEGSSGGIKPKPRKRLKLEECDASGTMSDDISDFSDDSNNVCDKSPLTCSSSVSSSVTQRELTPRTPSDHEGITSLGGRVLSTTDDKMEIGHSPEKVQTRQSDWKVECDKLDVSDHLVEAIVNGEEPLAFSSPSSTGDNTTGDSSLSSCLQSASNDVENLEELKAAAEEIFMTEWDDNDGWWEEESCSGQSSFPSSGETASSSSTVTSPGFTKCSDLYSVDELKSKLQATSEQPKTCTAATVDNVQQFEFDDNKTPMSSVNQGNCTPETAAVMEEDETDGEDDVPDAMKLKFCLSLYTERVYLYNEVNNP